MKKGLQYIPQDKQPKTKTPVYLRLQSQLRKVKPSHQMNHPICIVEKSLEHFKWTEWEAQPQEYL